MPINESEDKTKQKRYHRLCYNINKTWLQDVHQIYAQESLVTKQEMKVFKNSPGFKPFRQTLLLRYRVYDCMSLLLLFICSYFHSSKLSLSHLLQHGLDVLLHLTQALVWSSIFPREGFVEFGGLELKV